MARSSAHSIIVSTTLLALLTGASGARAVSNRLASAALPARAIAAPQPTPATWTRYGVETGNHATVYLRSDGTPKPLVILIHGSGCAPLMTVDADGVLHDTTVFQDVVPAHSDRFHFALIEKRGVRPLVFQSGMSREDRVKAFQRVQETCSAEFLQHATKPSRVDDVLASLVALGRERWVTGIVLAGHSEGTHVITGVLRRSAARGILAAGLFASAGPSPFYAGYAAGGADNAKFKTVFERVRMLQRADDDFMYEGLPARRWKTFWLEGTPIDDVRDSLVPLFVAQGGKDGSTLGADLFALEAIRQQPERSLRYVVVDGGDHAFGTPKGDMLGPLFEDFLKWATNPKRQTSIDLLK